MKRKKKTKRRGEEARPVISDQGGTFAPTQPSREKGEKAKGGGSLPKTPETYKTAFCSKRRRRAQKWGGGH